MAKLIKLALSTMTTTFLWIRNHKRLAAELILSALLALSVSYGITVGNSNKRLSERLEYANNNIEAYLDIVSSKDSANSVLKLSIQDLLNSNDSLIRKINSVAKENNIKTSSLTSAATQTQVLLVNASKHIDADIIEVLKDTIYKDSILFNKLTTVYYTISKDSVNIDLDISNTLYLYTYKKKQYKNKKNFFKRLLTLDFKKVERYKFEIVNSNDLLKESDIRIIEIE